MGLYTNIVCGIEFTSVQFMTYCEKSASKFLGDDKRIFEYCSEWHLFGLIYMQKYVNTFVDKYYTQY